MLEKIMVRRSNPPLRRSKHLCADAAYTGLKAQVAIRNQGYIAHVVGRSQEAAVLKQKRGTKARRWIVEVAHSWFNRFRKLLVRYELLHRSFVALSHLPAAIIVFRKIKFSVNII